MMVLVGKCVGTAYCIIPNHYSNEKKRSSGAFSRFYLRMCENYCNFAEFFCDYSVSVAQFFLFIDVFLLFAFILSK